MLIQIKVLKVEVTSKAGATGKPVQTMEVSYNNLNAGKIESKKLNVYYNKVVCDAFAAAKMDDLYDVTSEKEGEFWVWKSATKNLGQEAVVQPVPGAPTKAPYAPATKSTYETPEERAAKQVYIVRQSSLAQAIALLTSVPSLKVPPSRHLILEEAQAFVDWVFETKTATVADIPNDDFPE